eukprot:GHVS01041214.1.p2 GENE.GHVS01041214.1~~GHVS01041214.1.p2  ORF type:complete len:360 (-),score=88.87 GHVS01041214.1:293-1372(-)
MEELEHIPRSHANMNASKPRHVPAFCDVGSSKLLDYFGSRCEGSADIDFILKFYRVGIIGLKRVQKDDNHVEGYIYDICRRSTKLAIEKKGMGGYRVPREEEEGTPGGCGGGGRYGGGGGAHLKGGGSDGVVMGGDETIVEEAEHWTASIGFTNRSKRWTMCPSRVCCSSAVDRDKIVGQWKVLQLDPTGEKLAVPTAVKESYDGIMDDADYFVCTLCPQQTYHAKHQPQGSDVVFDKLWHFDRRYKYPQDVLVFADDELITRIVWLSRYTDEVNETATRRCTSTSGVSKYNGDAERAEEMLLELMVKVMADIRREDKKVGPISIEKRTKQEAAVGGGGGGSSQTANNNASRELLSRIF